MTGEGARFPGTEGRTHTGDSKAGATPADTVAHQKGGGSSWVSRGLGGAWEGQGTPVDESETQSPAGLHSEDNEKARPPREAGDGVKGAVQGPQTLNHILQPTRGQPPRAGCHLPGPLGSPPGPRPRPSLLGGLHAAPTGMLPPLSSVSLGPSDLGAARRGRDGVACPHNARLSFHPLHPACASRLLLGATEVSVLHPGMVSPHVFLGNLPGAPLPDSRACGVSPQLSGSFFMAHTVLRGGALLGPVWPPWAVLGVHGVPGPPRPSPLSAWTTSSTASGGRGSRSGERALGS